MQNIFLESSDKNEKANKRQWSKKQYRSFAASEEPCLRKQTIEETDHADECEEEEKESWALMSSSVRASLIRSLTSSPRQHVQIDASKGRIPALFLPYVADGSSKLLLCFHGNAEDLGMARELLEYLRSLLRVHVLAVEYPGYGVYQGSPDAPVIQADAQAVFDYITLVMKVPA